MVASELFAAQTGTKKTKAQSKAKTTAAAAASKAAPTDPATKLTTDAQFGDHMVGGQYQVPFETVSTVENEKSIDSLIGVRKNFKDRIERSKTFRDSK